MKIRNLVIVISLMLTACQSRTKDELLAKIASSTQHEIKVEQGISPENSANPYDKIGQEHNILLDSILHFTEATGDTVTAHIINVVLKCEHLDPSYSKYIEKIPPAQQDELFNDPNRLIDASKSTPEAKSLLHELLSTVGSIKSIDFRPLKSKIVILERKIMASQKLDEQEKRTLLSVTSVARYSAYYWFRWSQLPNNQHVQALSASVFQRIGAALAELIDADNFAIFMCAVDGTPPILWAPMSALMSLEAFRKSFLGN